MLLGKVVEESQKLAVAVAQLGLEGINKKKTSYESNANRIVTTIKESSDPIEAVYTGEATIENTDSAQGNFYQNSLCTIS
jgi:hypothetical protein